MEELVSSASHLEGTFGQEEFSTWCGGVAPLATCVMGICGEAPSSHYEAHELLLFPSVHHSDVQLVHPQLPRHCLLYTSDAADE